MKRGSRSRGTRALVRDASGAVRRVRHPRLWAYVFEPLVGWALAALAAMLGAPFWFDLLNKVMVVRSTVKPHEKSPEESSEDRQTPNARQTPNDRQTPHDHTFAAAPSTSAPAPHAATRPPSSRRRIRMRRWTHATSRSMARPT